MQGQASRATRFSGLFLCTLIAGCASYNRVANVELSGTPPLLDPYKNEQHEPRDPGEALIFLAFSGGGTRAAAFSYGVLEELRSTRYVIDGKERRLLNEVDAISSVSGGSFTAAYYGLFGDRIFKDYEDDFLKKNVQKALVHGLLNPINWFRMLGSGFDRTELAINYFNNSIFEKGTFADLAARKGPRIEINATDLSIGQRFSFNQDRFDLLCSDLSEFTVARAVAASSAVPLAFAPIALRNHKGCQYREPPWLKDARVRARSDPRLQEQVKALDSYLDKDNRAYIHLVDGGIADNLGVRAVYDRVQLMGGPRNTVRLMFGRTPRIIVAIVVNAQTNPVKPMDHSGHEPTTAAVLDAVTDAQLQRYNVESLALLRHSWTRWAEQLSTDGQRVTPYFIKLDFESIADPKKRTVFNNVATSLALPADEVDQLTEAGRRLLREAPEFRSLFAHIRSLDQGHRIDTPLAAR